MIKRIVPIVVTGLALWQWASWWRQREAQRQLGNAEAAKPHAVTTWEGEGGALPETGSQTASAAGRLDG